MKIKTIEPGSFVAVYVIGSVADNHPVKVGFSRRPESRLSSLQSGLWVTIQILKIRYVETQAAARKVEKEAHRILSVAGKGLMGEWFDVTPDKALEAIQWAALTHGVELHEPTPRPEVLAKPSPNYRPPAPPTIDEQAAMSRARQQRREQRGRY